MKAKIKKLKKAKYQGCDYCNLETYDIITESDDITVYVCNSCLDRIMNEDDEPEQLEDVSPPNYQSKFTVLVNPLYESGR